MRVLSIAYIYISIYMRSVSLSTPETLKCNVTVAKIILNPGLPINPRMTMFRSGQSTDLGRFIYANSITLTPGTIVTDISEEGLQVHCLTLADTQGEEDEMNIRVTRVEGSS